MVSDYSDAGQEKWLASKSIDLIRGTGRLAGPGAVEVDGVRHTAKNIVVATGSDAVIPPIPGLGDLQGIWTNREATGMKAVPRRLLVLGGGPVGVEMAQAVRRLGGEVIVVEGAPQLLAREPAALGEALAEAVRRDGSSSSSEAASSGHAVMAMTTSCSSTMAASSAATTCSWRPAGVRASTGSASRLLAFSPTRTAFLSTLICVSAMASGRSATSPACDC